MNKEVLHEDRSLRTCDRFEVINHDSGCLKADIAKIRSWQSRSHTDPKCVIWNFSYLSATTRLSKWTLWDGHEAWKGKVRSHSVHISGLNTCGFLKVFALRVLDQPNFSQSGEFRWPSTNQCLRDCLANHSKLVKIFEKLCRCTCRQITFLISLSNFVVGDNSSRSMEILISRIWLLCKPWAWHVFWGKNLESGDFCGARSILVVFLERFLSRIVQRVCIWRASHRGFESEQQHPTSLNTTIQYNGRHNREKG